MSLASASAARLSSTRKECGFGAAPLNPITVPVGRAAFDSLVSGAGLAVFAAGLAGLEFGMWAWGEIRIPVLDWENEGRYLMALISACKGEFAIIHSGTSAGSIAAGQTSRKGASRRLQSTPAQRFATVRAKANRVLVRENAQDVRDDDDRYDVGKDDLEHAAEDGIRVAGNV